jgi:hypothetical protein
MEEAQTTAVAVSLTVSRNNQAAASSVQFDCNDVGTPVTVQLLVTDASNNTATCSSSVTVRDVTPPVANCLGGITVQLDLSGTASIAGSDVDAGSSDGCGTVSLSVSPSTFSIADIGTPVPATLTVTDASGNTATCQTLVTVGDNVPPVAICAGPLTVNLDANGQASLAASDVDAGSSDNQGIASRSINPSTFDCSDAGSVVQVELTVSDISGNTASCTTPVTVLDVTPPDMNCVVSTSVTLDANGQATILPSDIDAGSSDNCGNLSLSVSPSTFDCTDAGSTVTVTLTGTDASQNVATCTSVVTVIDDLPPTASCVNGITLNLDASGQASLAASDLDNGSATPCNTPITLSASRTSFDCSDLGTSTVELTVTSVNNGKFDKCQVQVTVVDNLPPSVSCLSNVALSLDANGQASIVASDVVSGSSDNCGVVSTTISPSSFDCNSLGLNSVTVTVTDASQLTANCVATVDVSDVTPPVALCQAVTAFLDASGNALVASSDIDQGSSDNCGIASYTVNPNGFDCSDVGATGLTTSLTVTDASGNSASCSAAVTVIDNLPPVAVCQAVTAQLGAGGTATITAAMVDGGSSDNCGVASLSINQTSFQCNQFGGNSVTLTVTDVNGNTSQCSAAVSIIDNLPPTPVCVTSLTVALGPTGTVFVPASLVDGGSFDNCSMTSVVLSPNTFSCADVGSNAVTLTATDQSGNSNFCVSTIIIQDNIAPQAICQNVTVTLDGNGTATVAGSDVDGGSLDLCDLTLNVSPNTFDCSDLGANTVTLTVIDPNNNADSCTATVTVLAPNAMPTAGIITPDTTICSADTFFLKATPPTGGAVGQWTVPGNANAILPNTSSPVISVIGLTADSTYDFIWTVTEGCFSISDTVKVTVNESPFVLALESSPITTFGGSDGEATAVVLTNSTIVSYNWSNAQTTQIATGLSAGTYSVFVVDINGCVSNTDTVTLANPPATGVNVSIKAMLEGPYDPNSMLMDDQLRSFRFIPDTDPYFGTFTLDTTLFQTTGPDAIVDWVMVRLRSSADSTVIVDSTAALIQRDGDIVNVDNSSPVNFVNVGPGDYYVEVKHRNHLAIMTDVAVNLPGPPTTLDFFNGTTPAFGLSPMVNVGGKFLMYGGDADGNGLIENLDLFLEWLPNRGLSGYYGGDMDMNGIVENIDVFLLWLPNRALGSNVPN